MRPGSGGAGPRAVGPRADDGGVGALASGGRGHGRAVLAHGRPTIAMETYVRLMMLKARYRWGYRTLMTEVSGSIHLRRFCRISLSERVPDDSTVRKLTRRVGAELVNELTRSLIEAAVRQKRFRPRAVRIDSTGSRRT
jgi:IS5 family transposase